MISIQEPDVVCFLRKDSSERFLGPGREYGKEAAGWVRRGYDIVGIFRDGDEFVSPNSWLSAIANL